MTNNPYGFGFPAAYDILSECYGKDDHAVYARATLDDHLYLETNGGPIEISGEEDFIDLSYDDNATLAIYSLALRLAKLDCDDLADFISGNLSLAGRDDLALYIRCAIANRLFKRAQTI